MPVKERIIKATLDLFWRYGVKSVTMDDIAKELGISKKTIYQHFSDKDAIVAEVVETELDCEKKDIERMEGEANDPIDEVMRTSDYMRATIATMNPVLLHDLKKYHPAAWNLFQKHKHERIIRTIKRNLTKGIELGLYRNDLNVDILARMRIEMVEMAFDTTIYPPQQFGLMEIQHQFIHHFLRGILTESGFKLYNTYIEKNSNRIK